jgi:hypothetical protein
MRVARGGRSGDPWTLDLEGLRHGKDVGRAFILLSVVTSRLRDVTHEAEGSLESQR